MARVLAGMFGGSIPICQSYIADVIPVKERGRYFAILGSVIVCAFLFGPGIGAGLAEFSLQTPMFVSSAIAAFGLILAFFFFKEPRHLEKQEKEEEDGGTVTTTADVDIIVNDSDNETDSILTDSVDKYASKKYQWLVRIMWMVSFFNMLGFSSVIYFFGLFVFDQFGWGTLEVGFSTMLMGIFQVTIQILVFPKLQARVGKHGCGIVGSILSAVGLLLFGFIHGETKEINGLPLMVLAIAFASFGNAVTVPSLSSVLSRYTSQSKQGTTLGVAQSAEALARTIGPLVWGSVYETSRHLPFQISSAFYVVAGLLFSVVLYNNQTLPEHTQLVDCDASDEKGTLVDNKNNKKSLTMEEQVQSLLDENRILKEKLSRYEETFYATEDTTIDLSELMEIQRG
jgi:DHA1 family tetracycline resistance protein-like MFS transporter